MSSNQPTKLPPGYYVVKGPKGHAVYSDIVRAPVSPIPPDEYDRLHPENFDAPDVILVRLTPWRSTRYGAVTYFALNTLNKTIHDAP